MLMTLKHRKMKLKPSIKLNHNICSYSRIVAPFLIVFLRVRGGCTQSISCSSYSVSCKPVLTTLDEWTLISYEPLKVSAHMQRCIFVFEFHLNITLRVHSVAFTPMRKKEHAQDVWFFPTFSIHILIKLSFTRLVALYRFFPILSEPLETLHNPLL